MTIYLQYDHDSAQYEIWVRDDRMSPMPAGSRLFHPQAGIPIPDIQFSHDTRASAELDAGKLRAYLEKLPKRQPSKSDVRKAAA